MASAGQFPFALTKRTTTGALARRPLSRRAAARLSRADAAAVTEIKDFSFGSANSSRQSACRPVNWRHRGKCTLFCSLERPRVEFIAHVAAALDEDERCCRAPPDGCIRPALRKSSCWPGAAVAHDRRCTGAAGPGACSASQTSRLSKTAVVAAPAGRRPQSNSHRPPRRAAIAREESSRAARADEGFAREAVAGRLPGRASAKANEELSAGAEVGDRVATVAIVPPTAWP